MSQRICLVTGVFSLTLPICSGLTAWSRQHGPWRIETVSITDLNSLAWLRRAGYAGFVVVSPDAALIAELAKMPCPVICTQPDAGAPQLATVDIDNTAIGDMGAKHLLEKGYRRLAFYGVSGPWSIQRFLGFRTAAMRRNLRCGTNCPPESDGQWPEWDQATDEAFARRWLKGLQLPAGVMACDDLFGRLLADMAVEMKLRVPEDIAILGVDNTESLCESDVVTLSSVEPDLKRVGQEAGRLLSQMQGRARSFSGTVLVPPAGVVQRRSTSAAAFDDPEVAAAVKFIHENACDGISVEKVCDHVAMSRRQLERRFVQMLGRSPGDEIRRLRIDRARELLISTNLALADISVRCGYEHLSSFSAAFRDVMGSTPSQYRRDSTVH